MMAQANDGAEHCNNRRADGVKIAVEKINQPCLFIAVGEGFEPPMVLPMPVFKTGAIDRSAIPPFYYPAWIRTRTKRPKSSCATVTLPGISTSLHESKYVRVGYFEFSGVSPLVLVVATRKTGRACRLGQN